MSSSYLRSLTSTNTLAVSLGLSASSFLFWGNVGLARCGPFAIMGEKERNALAIRPAQAVKIWEDAYDRGA
jgi:hypothetical protein